MRTISLSIVGALLLSLGTGALAADQFSSAVVFTESGFPAADAAGPSAHQFAALLPGARFAPAGQLATLLKDPATRLLVLPYGSAFPEESWPEIFAFLKNGGNLRCWAAGHLRAPLITTPPAGSCATIVCGSPAR